LTNIIKNLHVSFETSLETSKFKRLDPDLVKYFGSYRIQIHCTAVPVLESYEEEEYCEQPDFSWLKYGRICTVTGMYY
jgi:hypothetical protein